MMFIVGNMSSFTASPAITAFLWCPQRYAIHACASQTEPQAPQPLSPIVSLLVQPVLVNLNQSTSRFRGNRTVIARSEQIRSFDDPRSARRLNVKGSSCTSVEINHREAEFGQERLRRR